MTSATVSSAPDLRFGGPTSVGLSLDYWVESGRRYLSGRSAGSEGVAEVIQGHAPSSMSFAQTKAPEMLTESDLRELALSRFMLLANYVQSGQLRPAQLAFAALALGEAPYSTRIEATLFDLLTHPMPMVREGAVYGLARIGSASARRKLEEVAEVDTSPGVREAAQEALED